MNAEQLGDGRAGDVGVQDAAVVAAAGHGTSQQGAGHALADTALARSDYINFAHTPYSYLSIGSMTICPSFIEARSARSVISMWSGERAMRFAMRICVGIR